MDRKTKKEKIKTRISVLEKDRQRKVDEQIELILKTDPEILQINAQIDNLKKMVKASEELERKKEELEKQMLDLLDQWEVDMLDENTEYSIHDVDLLYGYGIENLLCFISHIFLAFLLYQNGKIQVDVNLKGKELNCNGCKRIKRME